MKLRHLVLFLTAATSLACNLARAAGSSVVTTPEGSLLIAKVQESDRFPPDCQRPRTPGCDQAQAGFKIVTVWLLPGEAADGAKASASLMHNFKSIRLVSVDGTVTPAYSGGMLKGKLFVAFTPPTAALAKELEWPGNDAVSIKAEGRDP